MEWPAVVTALSTAAIALLLALPAVATLILIRQLSRAVKSLERFAGTLKEELLPAIQSARRIAQEATEVAGTVRVEVDGVIATSKDIRERIQRAADAAESRMNDLETLIDVVYEEVEDTALDVAAALRTTRRGAGVLAAMKRAFLRRGR